MEPAIKINVAFNPALQNVKDMFANFRVDSPVRDEINKVLFLVESTAKQLAPVRTGRLRSSIATSQLIDQLGGVVSTNVNYAIYVHEGTRYMRARPFMETAAHFVTPQMEGLISTRLDQEFSKAFKTL